MGTQDRIERIGRWLDRWRHRRCSCATLIADAALDGYPFRAGDGVVRRYEVACRASDALLDVLGAEWDRLTAERRGAA